jgi:outer membrane lipoprotein carrier protein
MKKIGFFLLLLWVHDVFCDATRDHLQSKLNAIRTMSASFEQIVTAKQHVLSRSSGSMALSRPGHFRWQTNKPMTQLVVADGVHLWVYDVDLEQVTVKKQKNSLGGAAALFLSSDDDRVTQDFDVTEVHKGEKAFFELRATSRKASFHRMKLVFEGPLLTHIELFDQLGQRTDVTLRKIKTNVILAHDLFRFKPPSGVDVLEQ